MSLALRTNSVCSIDAIPDGFTENSSAPASSAVSPTESDVDGNDSDDDDASASHAALAMAKLQLRASPATALESDERPCAVCHQLQGHNWVGLKTCGHQFHMPCIASWRAQHNTCPTCHTALSASCFTLKYLGGCFEESMSTDGDQLQLARDYQSSATPFARLSC